MPQVLYRVPQIYSLDLSDTITEAAQSCGIFAKALFTTFLASVGFGVSESIAGIPQF